MTATRDRERLDADAMKIQRVDNSVAPVTGASEGGGKVVARQLTAAGSPGVIVVPAVRAHFDLLGDDAPMMSMVRTTADGRPGLPEDIACAALFLASDEARFVKRGKPRCRRRGDGDPRVKPSPAAMVALPVH